MIQHSESINEIGTALAKAQAEIKGAIRDQENAYFNSRYADLANVWEACRPALTKHGLAVVQAPFTETHNVGMTTLLVHSSGQWISSTLSVAMKDLSPQAVGSACTYLRRYGLSAMVGVAPEDDDGNAAQGNTPEGATRRRGPVRKQGYALNPEVAERQRQRDLAATPESAPAETPVSDADAHTAALSAEREALLDRAATLLTKVKVTDQDKTGAWRTYCGAATRHNVDPAALKEYVGWLEARAGTKP